ncbi:hypothetical protein K469DRAFT_536332, partial [Zopfia rhizophila CBS 207.26]
GVGRHIWDVPYSNFQKFIQTGIAGGATYTISTIFTKVSILQLYIRLSVHQSFRVVAYIVIFYTAAYNIIAAAAALYYCRPIRKYWDFATPGTCINMGAAYLANAALNAAADVIILLMPIWLLRDLHLPRMQKIGTTLVLMTGSFVCAVSIVRLAVIPSGMKDPDITWRYVPNLIWCIIEMYTGIVCACLPSFKALAKHHLPRIF